MRKTVTICDNCGIEIPETEHPFQLRLTRKGQSREVMADICETCVGTFSFMSTARSRGRAGRKSDRATIAA